MTTQSLRQLTEKSERYLIPLGIWPSTNNTWITVFNIVVLFSFSVLVIIKNILNPEGESIENAFALANGSLCTVVYFVTMLVKKDKLIEYLEFVKNYDKILISKEVQKLTFSCSKEYQIVMSGLLCILPVGIAVRFLHPPLEYGYIQLLQVNRNFTLPAAMAFPASIFGDIPTYILESLIRMMVLSTLVGICSIFILSTLYMCTQFNILALKLEQISEDEDVINMLIESHQELLYFTKLLNEIFSSYFFADCLLSLINMSIMLFSLAAHNIRVSNYIVEVPLLTIGICQLFFVLYYGDRLIDATEQISDATYQSNWYTKSIKIKKKILLIIMMGQKPQTLNFGGNDIMVASMLLFSEICQHAWGAFNLLRSTV